MEKKLTATTETVLQKMEQGANLISEQPTMARLIAPLSDLVPEDAKAEAEGVPEDMQKYEKLGLFSRTAGMMQIENKCDGRLFAYISQEENGKRTIHYIQQYASGEFSPGFEISQSTLLMAAMGSKSKDPETIKECRKCFKVIQRDYLDKSCGMEITNISEIITSLAEILNRLPVVSQGNEMTGPQLYSEVFQALKTCCPVTYECYRRGGYFMMWEGEISAIAHELGMSERKLLEQLKNIAFFI